MMFVTPCFGGLQMDIYGEDFQCTFFNDSTTFYALCAYAKLGTASCFGSTVYASFRS